MESKDIVINIFESFCPLVLIYSIITHIFNGLYKRGSLIMLNKTRSKIGWVLYVFIPMFELIDFDRIKQIELYFKKDDNSAQYIKQLRISVNSELERKKHFAPIGVIITILVTVFLAVYSNFNTTAYGLVNTIASHSIAQHIKSEEAKGIPNNKISESILNDFKSSPEFRDLLNEKTDELMQEKINTGLGLFFFITLTLIIYWISYQISLSRLSKLKDIIDELLQYHQLKEKDV